MTEFNHTDDSGTLMRKLGEANNRVEQLREIVKEKGKIYNSAKGEFAAAKFDLQIQKDHINTLKILIRAEGSHL